MTKRGVVFLFSGVAFAERFVVACHSLRQHYSGPVTIFTTDDACRDLARSIGLGIDVEPVRANTRKRHSSYLIKTQIPEWTPYEQTVFVDGDTVVVAPFDELFEYPLVITAFSDWQTFGGIIGGRVRKWRDISLQIDEMAAHQLSIQHPAINTGVFGFRKNYAPLDLWRAITVAGQGRHMTDELAMQLAYGIWSDKEVALVDDRFNHSALFGREETLSDVRIRHCHGNKHCRRDRGQEVWLPALRATLEADTAGIRSWAGQHDPHLAKLLKPRHQTSAIKEMLDAGLLRRL